MFGDTVTSLLILLIVTHLASFVMITIGLRGLRRSDAKIDRS